MGKEPASPKLGDFYIGVLDFFSILLPGLIAAGLIAWHFHQVPEKPELLFWAVILVGGYVLGHLLHAAGGVLDWLVYDFFFEPELELETCYLMSHKRPERRRMLRRLVFAARQHLHRNHQLFAYVKKQISSSAEFSGGLPQNVFDPDDLRKLQFDSLKSSARPAGIYQWARAWLLTHSPEARSELDRLEADSKLFRSLSILLPAFVIARWDWMTNQRGYLPYVAIAGVLFCIWRYCDLRQKMVRGCYLHFVQISVGQTRTEADSSAQRSPQRGVVLLL